VLSWNTWYLSDPKKILAIIYMLTLKTLKDIQVFNCIAQYYQGSIKDFNFIMAPITKLFQKTNFQVDNTKPTSLGKKQCYMDALILISPHWDIECHVHTNASNLAIKVMLAYNLTRKYDQLIAYALQLFNNIE
jgi:hypothetical protein